MTQVYLSFQLHKTKTCLLLKACEKEENGYEIESFGYEAERMYIDMCKNDKDNIHKWYLVKRFKHLLYSKVKTKNLNLQLSSDLAGVQDAHSKHFFHILTWF